MKKKLAMILISSFLMGAVFVGCGNNDAPQAPATTATAPAQQAATTPAEPTPTPTAPPAAATTTAVQEFLDEYGDEIRAEFGDIAQLLGEGASIDIVAGTGEELVFVFAYGPDTDTDGVGDALELLMPMLGPVFELVASELQEELGVDEITVTVRYTDYAGNVLAEESFTAS